MIMRSDVWRDGRNALVVTFDEGDTNLGCYDGGDDPFNATTNSGGGHVVTVVIRNHDSDPRQDPTPYNHQSLVATLHAGRHQADGAVVRLELDRSAGPALTSPSTAVGRTERRWRDLGDALRENDVLARLATSLVLAGRNAEAETSAQGSLAILRAHPPGPELANALRVSANLRMLNRDNAQAVIWGEEAIALAEQVGETEVTVSALNAVAPRDSWTATNAAARTLSGASTCRWRTGSTGCDQRVAEPWLRCR